MQFNDCAPIIEVTRGMVTESIHYGAVSVVSADGKLIASYGNPNTVTFLRSSAKPFQILPFLAMGGMQHFHLTLEEVALMCASHSGTDEHARVATSILSKIGASEANLQCGTHAPSDEVTYRRMFLAGQSPTPIRHNCSGKHSGFLCFATMLGESLDNYLDPTNKIQQHILKNFAAFCDLTVEDIQPGIDGCSAPVFAVPMRSAALGVARLVDPRYAPAEMQKACQIVVKAMLTYPTMIAGPGKFDTRLMQAGSNRWISKAGAEGYQIIGILPGVLSPDSPGIGITIKTSDGDLGRRTIPTEEPTDPNELLTVNSGGRSCSLVAIEVLRQLGVLTPDVATAMRVFDRRPIRNFRKLVVGEIRPCFTLVR